MKIRIRRKKQPEWLALYIWIMPFLLPFFAELLRFPTAIKYTLDAAWLLLLFLMMANRVQLRSTQVRTLMRIAFLFLLITVLGFLKNFHSPLHYLWGFRNNFRFYVFFLACTIYLTQHSAEKCMSLIDGIFWVNFPLVLVQYFVLHKEQDFLGGVFGTQVGCNGYLNILLVIVVTKSILQFMARKEKLSLCLLKCAVALVVAVLSELKVFFVELLLIVFLVMLLSNFTFRKFGMVLLCVIGVVVGAQLVSVLFPVFEDWFSVEGIMEIVSSESGYTGRNDMNRLNAISYALERFLPSFFDKVIGLGLGNCDYSQFDILTSDFYNAYRQTNYVWFSTAFLLLETGFAGLVTYIGFFVATYFCADKMEKAEQANTLYCQMAKIMAIMSVVMVVYNAALRTEAGYMMYFVLSLPFLRDQESAPKLAAEPDYS